MEQWILSEAIDRIQRMERCFDTLQSLANTDPETIRQEDSAKELLQHLIEYYEGGAWLRDYEMDEAGLLPADLKRGVLSEDGVYNLLAQLCENEPDGSNT